jgi:hypothetical protein
MKILPPHFRKRFSPPVVLQPITRVVGSTEQMAGDHVKALVATYAGVVKKYWP